MMGCKPRHFDPIEPLTVEDLVPHDHFYRHLERSLDLAFVRELVVDCYAAGGRPSIDPVVFFKLQLVLFFEGLRSERQLLALAADRLSVRWYLGYDLDEPLPDHSSLTRIRDRYGIEVFRRFFDAIVTQCQQAGLVWGRELYIDATKVHATASLDSVMPRFAVEAHLTELFDTPDVRQPQRDPPATLHQLPLVLPEATATDLAEVNAARHDWLAEVGQQQREVGHGRYERLSNWKASRTDPDATLLPAGGGRSHLGYHLHEVVDGGKARIILAALVTPSEVMENQPMLDLVWHSCFRWQLWPHQVTGDTTYATGENIRALEEAGIRAYVPLADWDRTGRYGPSRFTFDAARDQYACPEGHALTRYTVKQAERAVVYHADPATCNACPVKAACTTSDKGRLIQRSFDAPFVERVQTYQGTAPYRKALNKRRVWIEPLFGEAKQWHGLRRFRLRRLVKVNTEALLIAAGQNIKRLLSRHSWGYRPWPDGAAGLRLALNPLGGGNGPQP